MVTQHRLKPGFHYRRTAAALRTAQNETRFIIRVLALKRVRFEEFLGTRSWACTNLAIVKTMVLPSSV